ncbi:putative CAP superfamily protein [Plasmopara halstedii]
MLQLCWQASTPTRLAGLSALCMNVKLLAASRRHSIDMAAKNFISHLGSDGSSMAMRITEAAIDD